MPISRDKAAPYAPSSALLEIISRNRSRGLPSPIDRDVLTRAGISESLAPRTLTALQALDLIDEEGKHTDTLTGLRLAREDEYQGRMADWLNAAYADVLMFVDPARDGEVAVRDAFRPFTPTGMQERMISLFIGLYTAAGVWRKEDPQRPNDTDRPRPAKTGGKKPAVRIPPIIAAKIAAKRDAASGSTQPVVSLSSVMPPALTGLLSSLPLDGNGWTKDRRDIFVTTFGAVLDFCIPVVPSKNISATDEND